MAECHTFSERTGNAVSLRPFINNGLTKLVGQYLATIRNEGVDYNLTI